MPTPLDLTFHPYLTSDLGAIWHGIPEQESSTLPAWQWSPAVKLVMDSDLDTINRLLGDGWERITGAHGVEHWTSDQGPHAINGERYLRLVSQLADVRLMKLPGQNDYELWARTADLQRAASLPVTLAFARHGLAEDDFPRGVLSVKENGLTTLLVGQVLPPPQFGEIALVDHALDDGRRVWQVYTLATLGDDGLALWQRMSQALKDLAAPGEWWAKTTALSRCINGEYPQWRELLRSELLRTRGKEREKARALLKRLDIDKQHADAINAARARARRDPEAALAQWEEIRQMAAELASLYWQAHQAATSVPASVIEAEAEAEALPVPEEARLIAEMVESNAATIDTTNFAEDRAVRMASLADKSAWTTENDVPKYKASDNLAVYFRGTRDNPLSLEEAQAQLLRIKPRTLVTIRIAMSLWNLRRNDAKLGRSGQALVTHNEILHWRGVPKQHRYAHPGTGSGQIVTDGWRTEDREGVREDFELASRYYLRGTVNVTYRGKTHPVNVDDYYVNVGFISIPTLWGDEPAGVWFGPGAWINNHAEADNYFLAEVDRRVFELNPHHEQHELKIALYLTERWREQASKGRYADPITTAELLQQSVIDVDRPNLTSRFAPRIEQALANLHQRGIIGSYECLTPTDKNKRNWGKDWLAARWRILPPGAIAQSYIDKGITQGARQLSPGRTGKSKQRGANGQ